MKIIDEKGKLFGRINVIDFLVLLFFLGLTPMFYFGYKIFNKKPPQNTPAAIVEAPKTFIETELNFILNKLEPETAQLILKGDREVNEKGEVIAEIISLGKAIPVAYEIDLGNQQKLIKDDPVLKKIPALLKIKAEFKDNVLYYKEKPIKINSVIDFITAKYKLEALYPSVAGAIAASETGDKIKDTLMPLEQKISLLNQEIGILKERIRMIESSQGEIKQKQKQK
ncbi:MAG: hypothetical protein A2216_01335 [Omnitrophica WOR_2 bacterium RIFOXYA2_FULL_45_12]|nr:MAG: hypothetical protein A2216_01335 [Omnitrophica WOR_2 bacterium RIFOXYA2_FULL_45_12]OGX60842.1 MAG: hypothetical protein A2471_05995 [Omnitrophica WOR_2 bacterium RIFOXYC2_FULL_45_15]